MNRAGNRSGQGFTIVELLVAMTFVSILMLAIAVTVIQISNIYNKGLTMRAVDQAGRALSLEIRQTVAGSQPFNSDTALRFQRYPNSDTGKPDGGRFCTGLYTYVWNFGKSMANPINKYSTGNDEIRFAKVRDNGGQYCADPTKAIEPQDAVELLSKGDRDLAIQSFKVTKMIDDPTIGQALYRIVMEIGTNNQDALFQEDSIDTVDTRCRPPSDDSSLQNFCAVNQFDFTVQAGNKGGA
jgi:type II secretory pathway pseudopilin PulG